MAQTQDAISSKNWLVQISDDAGSTWIDISGQATVTEPGSGARMTGTAYTFDGDTAILKSGKREPIELTLTIVYVETTDEAYDKIENAYENDSDLLVRWSPKGGATGDKGYKTDAPSIVTAVPYPAGEAETPDPILVEATLMTPSVTVSTITSDDEWNTV